MAIKKSTLTIISVTKTAIFSNFIAPNTPPGTLITNWISTAMAEDPDFVELVLNSQTQVINININKITQLKVWVKRDTVIGLLGAAATGFIDRDLINVVENADLLHIDFVFKPQTVAA